MAIELDKILTISLEEYCKLKEKKLSDYEIEGVHSFGTIVRGPEMKDSPKFKLASEVPDVSEVVVGYNVQYVSPSSGSAFYEANGNALILKSN
ncbi:MAG: hypothetical protein KAI67_03460 [Candidatus Pacebacteria bacterium]|nr:hypothetical protein [Candidatus Paceibacterota bacterium]